MAHLNSARATPTSRPVLLIVDGGAARQLMLNDLELKYGARYRLVGAPSGREALEALRHLQRDNERVALLLVDQRLPDMTGIEFLELTLLVREESLSVSMSRYLIEQIEETKNVGVRLQTTVVDGADRLEAITIVDAATGATETLKTNAMFVFIGGVPNSQSLDGVLACDEKGFILTGPELARRHGDGHRPHGWPLERDPFWLESSTPGVFVAGDVRHGSVKRVAAGVGEGATAVQFIHQYLGSAARAAASSATGSR